MPKQTPVPTTGTSQKGSTSKSGSAKVSNAVTPSPPPPSNYSSILVSNSNPNSNPNKRKLSSSKNYARPKKQVKISPSPVINFPAPVNTPSTGKKSESPLQSFFLPCKLRIRPSTPTDTITTPSSTTANPLVTGNVLQPSSTAIEIANKSGNLAAFAAVACQIAEADVSTQGTPNISTRSPTPGPLSAMEIKPELTLCQEPPLKRRKHKIAEQSLKTFAAVCKAAAEEESEMEKCIEEVSGRLIGDRTNIEERVREGMHNGGCGRAMGEVLKEFGSLKKRVAREVGGALWELEKIRRKSNQGNGSAGSATGGDAEGDELDGGEVEAGEPIGKNGSVEKRKEKESGKKRKRDNWSPGENEDFIRLVWKHHEGIEEMGLRRMLARHFGPRRSHEQCANHLRILRAQKRVPVAKGEAIVYSKKRKADEARVDMAEGNGGESNSDAAGPSVDGSRAEVAGTDGVRAMNSGVMESVGNP